ncbi:MAG: Transcription factor zinc-finger [Myxococcales bacterium]|nr:Transcription factor zinc-finger [Myxococcales bacterium]
MRDDFATCPHCDAGLEPIGKRLGCQRCNGVLVLEADVKVLVAEARTMNPAVPVTPTDLELAPPSVYEPAVRCPSCLTSMTKHTLHGLTIDRCDAHGIWFDGGELLRVLDTLSSDAVRQAQKLTIPQRIGLGLSVAGYIALGVIPILLGA